MSKPRPLSTVVHSHARRVYQTSQPVQSAAPRYSFARNEALFLGPRVLVFNKKLWASHTNRPGPNSRRCRSAVGSDTLMSNRSVRRARTSLESSPSPARITPPNIPVIFGASYLLIVIGTAFHIIYICISISVLQANRHFDLSCFRGHTRSRTISKGIQGFHSSGMFPPHQNRNSIRGVERGERSCSYIANRYEYCGGRAGEG